MAAVVVVSLCDFVLPFSIVFVLVEFVVRSHLDSVFFGTFPFIDGHPGYPGAQLIIPRSCALIGFVTSTDLHVCSPCAF